MKEKFPNLVKEMDMQVQEAQRVPIMMDAKRPTLRHIIIKRPKGKDKDSQKQEKRSYWKVARLWGAGGGRMSEEVRELRNTNR